MPVKSLSTDLLNSITVIKIVTSVIPGINLSISICIYINKGARETAQQVKVLPPVQFWNAHGRKREPIPTSCPLSPQV